MWAYYIGRDSVGWRIRPYYYVLYRRCISGKSVLTDEPSERFAQAGGYRLNCVNCTHNRRYSDCCSGVWDMHVRREIT